MSAQPDDIFSDLVPNDKSKPAAHAEDDDIFSDLAKPGAAENDDDIFSDLVKPGTKLKPVTYDVTDKSPHAPKTPVSTGVGSKVDSFGDVLAHAFGGLVGAYNSVAQIPGMIAGGLASGPAAILHALDPNFMSAEEAVEAGEDAPQIHLSGRMGQGEQAAEQAIAYPFAKAAEGAGSAAAEVTNPNAPTNDANFQSRFGIPSTATPQPPAQPLTPTDKLKADVAQRVADAQREAGSRTGGEFLANLLMSLGGGEEGAKAVEGKGEPKGGGSEPPPPPPPPPAAPAPTGQEVADAMRAKKAADQKAKSDKVVQDIADTNKVPGSSSSLTQDALAQAEKELQGNPDNAELKDRVAALREAAGSPQPQAKPAQQPAPKPFTTPAQDRLTKHFQEAQADGLTQEQAKKYAPTEPVDSVTGLPDQRVRDQEGNNPRIAMIQKAQQHVAETGQPAHYVAFDFDNLGGLNHHLTETGANSVLKDAAQLAVGELQKVPGAQVHPGRHGGDEFNAVVVGGDPDAVRAAVDTAKTKAQALAKQKGLDTVPHTKAGRAPGIGLHAGVEEITPDASPAVVMSGAERDLEAGKGVGNVAGAEAQKAGAGQVAPRAEEERTQPATGAGEEGQGRRQNGPGRAGEVGQGVPGQPVKEAREAAPIDSTKAEKPAEEPPAVRAPEPQREAPAQELNDRLPGNDAARNSGRKFAETSDPTDLFSEASHQTDLTDKQPRSEIAEPKAATGKFSRGADDRRNRIITADVTFGRAVDAAIADKQRVASKVDMGPTPDVLLKTGAKDLPLAINASTIRKVVMETGKHRIPADTLKKLTRAIHEPVMVFGSNKEPDSRVVLTDLKDADGKPIAAVVRFNQREGRHEVNGIATVSDRRPEAINDWIKAGLLRYMDTKKGRAWAESVGLPSPEEPPKSDPSSNVLTEKDIVKPFKEAGFLARGQGVENPHTVSTLRTELQHGMGRSKFDRLEQAGLVKLHDKATDIPLNKGDKAADVSGVRGYFDGTTMHLAAENISKDRGMGVLVHEALHQSGVEDGEGGLKQLIGAPFEDLDKQFQRLYDSGDKQAVAAHDHATANYPEGQVPEERLAKLVEDVTNAQAAERPKKFSEKALDLVRRVVTSLRARFYKTPFARALEKAGVKMDLTPKDIAELARQSLDSMHSRMSVERGEHFSQGEDHPEDSREAPRDSISQKVKDATDKLHQAMQDGTPDMVRDFFRGVTNIATPLANGTKESAATAKDYANAVAEARIRLNDTDARLKKNFDADQRRSMWEATSAENVGRVMKSGTPKDGFESLTPEQRKEAEDLQKENAGVAEEATRLGILPHRFALYDPRFLARLAEEQGGSSVLNPKGHDIRLTTPHAKAREHITAPETEAAAKALYGDDAHLIKDIRILPHAIYNLRRIIAARHLMDALERYGDEHGVPTVLEDDKLDQPGVDKGKYFTIDNPAFRRNGRQLHVHNDFRGPLTAVLRENSPNMVERAFMGLKSKAMGMIVGAFPPVHRSVVFFKTVLAYPGAMLQGKLQAEGRDLRLSNSEEKYQATRDGLRDVSQRGWAGSIDDVERETQIDEPVGKSWTAKMLGAGAHVAGATVGKGKEWDHLVRGTVDDLGHLWHSTLMWDKVANTQYGLYKYAKRDLIEKGMDPDGAGKVAAQLANRYVGSIPYEDMGKGMRTALNLMFFSRSFTFSNLGVYKDVAAGLPKAIQGQIERNGREINAKIGNDFARRKAAALLVKDILMLQVMNSALQSTIAYFTNQQSGDEIVQGYSRRASKYLEAGAHNPLKFLDVNSLTPNSENEPGKQEYVYVGRDKQGTGVYLKDPFGKIGQDLLDAMTSPLSLFNHKESTELGPALAVIKNDKGYGRQVYDEQADGMGGAATNILAVTKYLIQAQGPTETVEDAANLVNGSDTSKLNIGKTLGAPLGLFFSHGAPGGPAAGFVYAEQKEHAYQVQQVMPKAYALIRQGRYADAIEAMKGANMTPGEMRARIRFGTDPAHTIMGNKGREFWERATPEQREAFVEALNNEQ